MAIVISGTGIDMGGNPVSNASQIDSVLMNENGASVATETQVGTANSTLVKTALNATGAAPIYACRAWVNFNGTGTVAIRASGNVSSITDNGAGDYTVNFTTAMPDTNYCPSGICGVSDNDGQNTPIVRLKSTGITSTTSFSFYTPNNNPSAGGFTDMPNIVVKVVR